LNRKQENLPLPLREKRGPDLFLGKTERKRGAGSLTRGTRQRMPPCAERGSVGPGGALRKEERDALLCALKSDHGPEERKKGKTCRQRKGATLTYPTETEGEGDDLPPKLTQERGEAPPSQRYTGDRLLLGTLRCTLVATEEERILFSLLKKAVVVLYLVGKKRSLLSVSGNLN